MHELLLGLLFLFRIKHPLNIIEMFGKLHLFLTHFLFFSFLPSTVKDWWIFYTRYKLDIWRQTSRLVKMPDSSVYCLLLTVLVPKHYIKMMHICFLPSKRFFVCGHNVLNSGSVYTELHVWFHFSLYTQLWKAHVTLLLSNDILCIQLNHWICQQGPVFIIADKYKGKV